MKKTKRDFEEAATKKNMREKMSLPFFLSTIWQRSSLRRFED
jgi:hypothetical protein